ncbi:MAG: MerR family transcriptional regulator [Magnetococcales bacterium]|nr:MerR family transcriptional regulator [Magnetococcales bacterium]
MSDQELTLPDKLYFSIGEVSKIVQVASHVLRYWEKMFPQVRPVKRKGNRRFYRQQDVRVLLEIRHLLYDKRFTVDGAKKHLQEVSKQDALAKQQDKATEPEAEQMTPQEQDTLDTNSILLEEVRLGLQDLHKQLVHAAHPDGETSEH